MQGQAWSLSVTSFLFVQILKHSPDFFNRYSNLRSVLARLRQIRYRRGTSRTGYALRIAKRYLFRGRVQCGRKRILVLVTDGRSRGNFRRAAFHLRRAGVEVIAIGVSSTRKIIRTKHLLRIATDSRHVFRINIRNLRRYIAVIRNLACRG